MRISILLLVALCAALSVSAKRALVEAKVTFNDGTEMKLDIEVPIKFNDLNHQKIQNWGFIGKGDSPVQKIKPELASRVEFDYADKHYLYLSACPTSSGKTHRFYEVEVEGSVTVGIQYNLPNSDLPEFHYVLIDQQKEGKTAEATFGFKPIQEIKDFIPYCEEVWMQLDQNTYGIYNLPVMARYYNEHCEG